MISEETDVGSLSAAFPTGRRQYLLPESGDSGPSLESAASPLIKGSEQQST